MVYVYEAGPVPAYAIVTADVSCIELFGLCWVAPESVVIVKPSKVKLPVIGFSTAEIALFKLLVIPEPTVKT